MREIKFRAWDKQKTCWLDQKDTVYLSDEGEAFVLVAGAASDWLRGVNVDIQLYTNLLDKHGKERCQGDIIRRNTGYTFVEEMKMFSLGPRTSAQAFGYDYHPDDEIIGNLYDNPELLP